MSRIWPASSAETWLARPRSSIADVALSVAWSRETGDQRRSTRYRFPNILEIAEVRLAGLFAYSS